MFNLNFKDSFNISCQKIPIKGSKNNSTISIINYPLINKDILQTQAPKVINKRQKRLKFLNIRKKQIKHQFPTNNIFTNRGIITNQDQPLISYNTFAFSSQNLKSQKASSSIKCQQLNNSFNFTRRKIIYSKSQQKDSEIQSRKSRIASPIRRNNNNQNSKSLQSNFNLRKVMINIKKTKTKTQNKQKQIQICRWDTLNQEYQSFQ